jgi:hypothetical protein
MGKARRLSGIPHILLPIVYCLLAIGIFRTLLFQEHYKNQYHFLVVQIHTPHGILHSTWNFGRFPLPLQPIKTTGRFIDSISLIFNLL